MKVKIGKYKRNGKTRKIKVKISVDDTISLDYTLSHVILASLKKYKKVAVGKVIAGWSYRDDYDASNNDKGYQHKHNEIAKKRMIEILDKMIHSFEAISNDDFIEHEDTSIQEGLDLFAKYYRGLWW